MWQQKSFYFVQQQQRWFNHHCQQHPKCDASMQHPLLSLQEQEQNGRDFVLTIAIQSTTCDAIKNC